MTAKNKRIAINNRSEKGAFVRLETEYAYRQKKDRECVTFSVLFFDKHCIFGTNADRDPPACARLIFRQCNTAGVRDFRRSPAVSPRQYYLYSSAIFFRRA